MHPTGVLCSGTLHVAGRDAAWGVPWLDRHASYPAIVRWSHALGTPRRLPDALGLAVRVEDAGGPDRPLDLLFTSSGTGRLGRHVPLLRPDALTGAYSTLLTYRTGSASGCSPPSRCSIRPTRHGRRCGRNSPAVPSGSGCAPPRAASPGSRSRPSPWKRSIPLPRETTVSYDPVAHSLPGLCPAGRLNRLRDAAYAGSRRGRGAA